MTHIHLESIPVYINRLLAKGTVTRVDPGTPQEVVLVDSHETLQALLEKLGALLP